MLTLDPINRQHVYITQDGYRFTYNPQAQVWTDGDMEFSKNWVEHDLWESIEDAEIVGGPCAVTESIRASIDALREVL